MAKKILLYAFSSWGKNNINLSAAVLQELDFPIDKMVLQVRFDQQPFLDMLAHDYTHIIGLGQYPRGNLIRIEQVAHNVYGTKSKGFQVIDPGPAKLFVDLDLQPTKDSYLTYDAGKYVCNYSMYTILRNKQQRQKYAFLHIPKKVELHQAVECVSEILKQVT